jgi:hypothetical protein
MKKVLCDATRATKWPAILVGALGLVAGGPALAGAPPGGLDVEVVNELDNPVPVTGALVVDGTAAVTVTNEADDPVPVVSQVDRRIPFQIRDTGTVEADSTGFSQNGFSGTPFADGRVPFGYRAILTYASVEVCADKSYNYVPGTLWSAGILSTVTTMGTPVTANVKIGSTPTSFVGGPGPNFVCFVAGTIAQPVHIVVEESRPFLSTISRNYLGAEEDYTIVIQGVLEPLPQ